MGDTIIKDGLYIPNTDIYFPKNGFQVDHVFAVFDYVKKFGVALDVGAHVGSWCVHMAKRFKTVYAFEPAPDSFECLQKNVGHFPNVHLYNVAVGEKKGKCAVVEDISRPGNTGSRFISRGKGTVDLIRLDDLNIEKCNLMKLDVEGYEYPVLRGAQNILNKFRPVIIMEVKTFHGRYYWGKHEASSFLLNHGYREAAAMRPDKIFVYGR